MEEWCKLPKEERKKILEQVIKKANEDQKTLMDKVKRPN